MNIWLLPDPHFGHNKLIDLGIRPEGFEEKILTSIKSCVKFDDVLLILGDFCFVDVQISVKSVKDVTSAKLWLVRGNHDNASISKYVDCGFDFCADNIGLNYGGHRLLFSHKPVEDLGEHTLNIHGHLHMESGDTHHNKEFTGSDERHIDMSLERDGLKVVRLKTLLKYRRQTK